jgi:hypothetical protein
MKMPNNEQAFVADNKIDDYLLSDIHIDGKHKAAFFKRFGFDSFEQETFKKSLLDHAKTREVVTTTEDGYGTKYVLECELKTPDERNPCVKSVWIIVNEESDPRLVTAYPKD